jgi:hypothetical protein
MRVSKISLRETKEVGPFAFRRIELEISVLKDDNLEEAKNFAVAQMQSMFYKCSQAASGQDYQELESIQSDPTLPF